MNDCDQGPDAYHSRKLFIPPLSVYRSQKKSPPKRRIFFGLFRFASQRGTPQLTEEKAIITLAFAPCTRSTLAYLHHRISGPPPFFTRTTFQFSLIAESLS